MLLKESLKSGPILRRMEKAVDATADHDLDSASGDGFHQGQKAWARHAGAPTVAI
jgi:hypothetical protein